MDRDDPLQLFLPPVREWFRTALGEPTAAQREGWPSIAAGQNTLILAPTGSGKTLAAFLACLDRLWRQPAPTPGIRVLYVSPLKALNNDIYRNLQVPLEGIAAIAQEMGHPLPALEVAVRTGDTPASERRRLLRSPPHVLITTPESLHLLLTSQARETLRSVEYCIVDEIHALCPNKRGVFLALLLERLRALTGSDFIRIGLSATQRPLEEVARYLGGSFEDGNGQLQPRPVTIVNAGLRKDLNLKVISPVEHFGPLPERSIWPPIYRLLGEAVRQHQSTIIFANNRRTVERITAHLNHPEAKDDSPADESEDEGQEPSLLVEPGPGDIARAHHGSIALEMRRRTEEALKEGRLRAVVATASLELGIDMGAVDLVCQVESPGSVARGLQRVGRAGHLIGRTSKGRLIPKTMADLLEQAVLARSMARGAVEQLQVPVNCLDVLAQQVVAMVAMENWAVPGIYSLIRQAYPYRDLTPEAFEATLEMISGRYSFQRPVQNGAAPDHGNHAQRARALASLQPRVSWDRIHNVLRALPGSQHLALINGGTIPDTGQYAAYTTRGVRIGELDEEFIYERRVGDTFALGTNVWRLENIEADRVIVAPAEGAPALIPFWHGERSGRSYDLGVAIGQFLGEVAQRLDAPDCLAWLQEEYFLDAWAAWNLRSYVRRQLVSTGSVPTDQKLIVEASRDPLGDWQVIVLSPFGSRLNLALRLAIESRLTSRLGYRPQCLHHDDGVLIHLADTDEPMLDLFEDLTSENVEGLILDALADSALFALRFRQNAARALLMPRMQPGKRAPLWLQRLRGRDLLQVARQHPDFPIVIETFRECLHDHLDVPRLQTLLDDIRAGKLAVEKRRGEKASPFASGLLFAFTVDFMYKTDRTDPEPGRPASLDRQLLEQLIAPARPAPLADPQAIHQVERRLRGMGQPPRTPAEMTEWLRRLGDLSVQDLEGPMAGFLQQLETEGTAARLTLPQCSQPERWVLVEEEKLYRDAFGLNEADPASARRAAETILARFLETHALVGLEDILDRYPFEPDWARKELKEWSRSGRVVQVDREQGGQNPQWSAPENWEQIQRKTLALMRQEVSTCPALQFADFVLRWQKLHPTSRQGSTQGLATALDRLQGLSLPAELWERTIFPIRVPEYQPRWLDEMVAAGEWAWVGQGNGDKGLDSVAFWKRESLERMGRPETPADMPPLDPLADKVLQVLRTRGASFLTDLIREIHEQPSVVRACLWTLTRRSLVTNDQFDVVRRGETADLIAPQSESPGARSRIRRQGHQRAEGRWSLLPWGLADPAMHAVDQARLLLERYGIVARELALLDPAMVPWRVLYEVLSRMEMVGEVRRGYFVEGLSGAQFALPEAAQMLQDVTLPSTAAAPVVLIHSLDPANLYGAGAPFDIPLLDGGTRPLLRRVGNWLVLRAGRPVLLIEQQGKRLTALASASAEDVSQAVACLPETLTGGRGPGHKLTVEEWNGQPVTTTVGRELLEAAGFVRDYQGMTLYAAWR